MYESLSSKPGSIVSAVIMPLLASGVRALPPGTGKSTIIGSGRVSAHCRA